MKNHFLIASFSGGFAPARRGGPAPHHPTHRHSPIAPFLFNTNKPSKITTLSRALLKTKEKQFSIQYKFALRGIQAELSSHRRQAWLFGIRSYRREVRGGSKPRRQNCPCSKSRVSLLTTHYSPLTDHDAEVGLCSLTCRSYGSASRTNTAANAPTTRSPARVYTV